MRLQKIVLVTLLLLSMKVLPAQDAISLRGYYFTFGRMPTLGLPEWKAIFDGIHADGGNLVLLWIGGGFRSEKFPITWRYNRDHKNIQNDFVRELIDYAHGKGIKVLLGFTPFSYDGVNQYTLEHPALKAVQANGRLVRLAGIHSWGYALNPWRDEAQQFMLEYIRELFFDFYPNADGLMIESSDYSIAHCAECSGTYYEKEFQFVEQISKDVWRAKPEAMVLVYPHYFSGRKVPSFGVSAAKQKFDRRWALFFTPHSAHIDPDLLPLAKTTIWWDTAPARHTPKQIKEGAQQAQKYNMTGYVPSFESFTFMAKYPDFGENYLIGTRLKPFGFGWLREGENPYNELLIRVNRIAYREFTRDPGLAESEFRNRLGAEIFGTGSNPDQVQDLLFLQESFFLDGSWISPSPLVAPAILEDRLERGILTFEQLATYRDRLGRIKALAKKYSGAAGDAAREMSSIAAWIVENWKGKEQLVHDHLRASNLRLRITGDQGR